MDTNTSEPVYNDLSRGLDSTGDTLVLNAEAIASGETGVVLVIAASDPSDGAGVTSDLRTLACFGVRGASAVTAVTWQNCRHYGGMVPMTAEVVKNQLEAVLAQYGILGIQAVKIGVLPDRETALAVISFLAQYRRNREELGLPVHIVWDPVGSASAEKLSANAQTSGLTTLPWPEIMPLMAEVATVITPNIPEALAMSGYKPELVHDVSSFLAQMEELADFFIAKGFKFVLLKGGHMGRDQLLGSCHLPCNADLLTDGTRHYWLLDRRRFPAGGRVHGTGCALASAMAAMLAEHGSRFDDVLSAAVIAKAFVTRGISEALAYCAEGFAACVRRPLYAGELSGLLPAAAANRQEIDWFLEKRSFPECPFRLGFYTVVDSVSWIERLCKCGVKTLQLRIKDPARLSDKEEIMREIKRAAELGREYGARIFVDDLWQEAASGGAWGVHLGQEDLDTAVLAKIRDAGLRLGVSTHSFGELARAMLLRPSYVALGHIFPTQSKVMPSAPQGLYHLRSYVEALGTALPSVAIGGIKTDTAPKVAATGTGSIAVITAVTKAPDPEEAVKTWLKLSPY